MGLARVPIRLLRLLSVHTSKCMQNKTETCLRINKGRITPTCDYTIKVIQKLFRHEAL